MPTRRYLVSQIDEGIKRSIENSEYLLKVTKILHERGHLKPAIIFYTYALEEFGKALMLKENKLNTLENGEDEVEDNRTFSYHKLKINKALYLLDTQGLNARIPWISKATSSQFQELTDFGSFVSEENRVKLLLVDYDSNKKKWVDLSLPWAHDVQHSINAFEKGLKQWKKQNLINSSGES